MSLTVSIQVVIMEMMNSPFAIGFDPMCSREWAEQHLCDGIGPLIFE